MTVREILVKSNAWKFALIAAACAILSAISYAFVLEVPEIYPLLKFAAPVFRLAAWASPLVWIALSGLTLKLNWRVGLLQLVMLPIALIGPLMVSMLIIGCSMNSENCP